MKKKICLIIEGTYPWYIGGVSEWVYRYIETLADFNFHIMQISTDDYHSHDLNNAVYPIPENVIKFTRLSMPPADEFRISVLKKWASSLIKNSNECEDANFIHVTNTGFAGLFGLTLAKKKKKPLFLTEHALYWREVEMGTPALECGYKLNSTGDLQDKFSNLFKEIASQIYVYADETVSVSKCNLPFQTKLGSANPTYIPNGVPVRWFDCPVVKKTDIDELVIGWIGRCADMKDPLKFLAVAKEFKKNTRIKHRFLMLLSDTGEKTLKQKVIKEARGIGNLELIWNCKTFDFIDQMDAVLVTSKNESQPLILFEAISRNILPAGWRVGDATSEYGFFVSPGTENDIFIESIIKMWANKEEWYNRVKSIKDETFKHHNWNAIFNEYKNLIIKMN